MELHNLYKESYVYEGDFTIESGIEVTEEIIKENPNIEAIFYSNDMIAFESIKYF